MVRDIVDISGFYHSTFALNSAGEAWGWGNNGAGTLGDGTTTLRDTPARLSGLPSLRSISVDSHVLALTTSGDVYAWGNNNFNQVLPGASTTVLTPLRIRDVRDAEMVAAGHVAAVVVGPAYSDVRTNLTPATGASMVGDTVQKQARVVNDGPFPAVSVVMTATGTSGIAFESESGPFTCTITQPRADCQLAYLGLGAAANAQLSVAGTSPGSQRIDVVAIPRADPDVTDATDFATLTVQGVACTIIGTGAADTILFSVDNEEVISRIFS